MKLIRRESVKWNKYYEPQEIFYELFELSDSYLLRYTYLDYVYEKKINEIPEIAKMERLDFLNWHSDIMTKKEVKK